MSRNNRYFSAVLLVSFTLFCRAPGVANANEKASLPAKVDKVLGWLPEDTETIVVAQSFPLPVLSDYADDERPSGTFGQEAVEMARGSALGALADFEEGKYLKPLARRQVAVALCAGRNFEYITTTLPTYRSESCAIVVFERDLGKSGAEWLKAVRDGASEVRTLAGREVFAFPAPKSMRPERKHAWPGTLGVYVVHESPDTLLCATSDKYLEQLLERMQAPAARRALPADLPEWGGVDPEAPAWMLRHIPEPAGSLRFGHAQVIGGIACTASNDRFHVVYFPVSATIPEQREMLERKTSQQAERMWRSEARAELLNASVQRQKDGTVAVSISNENEGRDVRFAAGMMVYYLAAESGEDFDE